MQKVREEGSEKFFGRFFFKKKLQTMTTEAIKTEPCDVFLKYMEWGQLIHDSQPEDIQKWIISLTENPDTFRTLQLVLFEGFRGFQTQSQSEVFVELHPANLVKNDVDSDDNSDDGERIDLCCIGKDLGVYVCQYLDLRDLIRLEHTSRYCMKLARHPASLYAMNIMECRNPTTGRQIIALNCQGGKIRMKKLDPLGYCRFANLRRLEIAAPLPKIPWKQLLSLDIQIPVKVDIPPQMKLEQLECQYHHFLDFCNQNLIPNGLLQCLNIGFFTSRRDIDSTPRTFPSLKDLVVEGDEWLDWKGAIQFVNTIQCPRLTTLEITVVLTVPNEEMVEPQIMQLLPKCDRFILSIFTKRLPILPNLMNLITKRDAVLCQKMHLFINLDYDYAFVDNDLKAIEKSDFWTKEFWPDGKLWCNVQKKKKYMKFTLSVVISMPYASDDGTFVYDVKAIRRQMKKILLDKYSNCKLKWEHLQIAHNVAQSHQFDLWFVFVV